MTPLIGKITQIMESPDPAQGVNPVGALLSCAAFPYAAAMRLRADLYARGLIRSNRVGARVLSVGNLTVVEV